MNELSLDILVLSDLHHHPAAKPGEVPAGRHTALGPLLAHKALQRLRHEGTRIDLVLLLGDLADGTDDSALEVNLMTVVAALKTLPVPWLAVPGNHDGAPARFAALTGCAAGLHAFDGYGFLLFHDDVGEGDRTTRPAESLAWPAHAAQAQPGRPLIAVQHNPLHPPIASDYPYLPVNTADILRGYREAGVVLSLSGHYHPGQPAHDVDGTLHHTVGAACEAPFRFSHVRLRGRAVEVREHALRMAVPGLVDIHCHTQFAYCATTVSAPQNRDLSRLFGLGGVGIVEHTFQLYFDREEAWRFGWFSDPARVRAAWRERRGRMAAYRQFVAVLRGAAPSDEAGFSVRFGLEADVCADGSLLLADEDRDGWDYLIGAVHKVDGYERGRTPPDEAETLFLRQVERLLQHPVQVLAHPFRWFQGEQLPAPAHLYPRVARWLGERGVAAELNTHNFPTDPAFIRACLDRGVRIALGTDSHAMEEVGELQPHLQCLRSAGAADKDLPRILYWP